MIMELMNPNQVTNDIIKAFYSVYNALGFGFLERVYENALVVELNELGHSVKQQQNIKVRYKGIIVGEYFADLVVEDMVIVELKAVESLVKEHETQLINYLKATQFELGLLLNFGKKAEIKRKIFTINRKK